MDIRNAIMCDHDMVENEANTQADRVEEGSEKDDTLDTPQTTQRTGGCQVGSSPLLT